MSSISKYIILSFFLFITIIDLTAQDITDSINFFIKKAEATKVKDDLDLALSYYNKALVLIEKTPNEKLLLKTYENIGDIHEAYGRPYKAIDFYHHGEKLSLKTNDSNTYARILGKIGVSYSTTVQSDTAFYYFDKALEHVDTVRNKKEFAKLMLEIGRCYFINNDRDNAYKFYDKSYIISNSMGYYPILAKAANGIGNSYAQKGDYKSALLYRKEALKILIENNVQKGQFDTYNNLGNNLMRLQQYNSAIYYFKKAEYIGKINRNNSQLSTIYQSISNLYILKKEYTKAIYYLNKGFGILKQNNDHIENIYYSNNFYKAYKAYKGARNYKKSLEYHEKFKFWTDSVTKASSQIKMLEFKVKYETKLKENQIAILSKENELKSLKIIQTQKQHSTHLLILSIVVLSVIGGILIYHFTNKSKLVAKQENMRFKSVIEAEEKERKRIAQDLHDSLGQAISAMMISASNLNTENEEEEKKLQKLLSLIDRTYEELRNISHNIMPNTLITLGLIPAIRELIDEMSVAQNLKITFSDFGNFEELEDTQTIALYRIIQEALSNIIKHAQASKVVISLNCEKNELLLSIKDNGIGINTSKIGNVGGIGWKNILSRVAILTGEADLKSAPGKGTHLFISFDI
ncbi:tetratricopeptide repeat-containing sensor histidine kinase [Zobellia galactanivorans]|uniref:histidine kinase n=1 Tax=Zobellia galactanivorans (strain DSM 12802 / CCUG 47099 / CIP 106680 / NCIMB 13871 / Dsij) TaxID=63186 RepID=G0L765_ZOBGA|nr:sensor histidine kinase [Zobellia galactanivorans]CAZ97196.1 Two-component system-Sensor histidine kinase [Zobellia galactanivorans]